MSFHKFPVFKQLQLLTFLLYQLFCLSAAFICELNYIQWHLNPRIENWFFSRKKSQPSTTQGMSLSALPFFCDERKVHVLLLYTVKCFIFTWICNKMCLAAKLCLDHWECKDCSPKRIRARGKDGGEGREWKGSLGRTERGEWSGGKILHTLTTSGHPEKQQFTSPALVNKQQSGL